MPTLLNVVKSILSNAEVQHVLRAAAAEALRVLIRRNFKGEEPQ